MLFEERRCSKEVKEKYQKNKEKFNCDDNNKEYTLLNVYNETSETSETENTESVSETTFDETHQENSTSKHYRIWPESTGFKKYYYKDGFIQVEYYDDEGNITRTSVIECSESNNQSNDGAESNDQTNIERDNGWDGRNDHSDQCIDGNSESGKEDNEQDANNERVETECEYSFEERRFYSTRNTTA